MYLRNICLNIVYLNTVFEITTYYMVSRAGLKFFSSIFNMFQTPQLLRIGDDTGQHISRVKKYIDDIQIDHLSEKIRIYIGSLETNYALNNGLVKMNKKKSIATKREL